MVLAGLIASQNLIGRTFAEHTYLFLGAWEVGCWFSMGQGWKVCFTNGTLDMIYQDGWMFSKQSASHHLYLLLTIIIGVVCTTGSQ
ncbi:unnamed protein product [Urochloa humidicola]